MFFAAIKGKQKGYYIFHTIVYSIKIMSFVQGYLRIILILLNKLQVSYWAKPEI